MIYKKIYSQLVDELEKIFYKMLEDDEKHTSVYYFPLMSAIEKCEKMFYDESTSVEEMRSFPRKYGIIYSKFREKYKKDLEKRGMFLM